MQTDASSDAGFSLMETLVALFVVALLYTAGGSLLLGALNGTDRVERLAQDIRQYEVASALMRDDFAAMTNRASAGPDGLSFPSGPLGTDGTREGLILAFVRGGWARYDDDVLRSDLLRVEYERRGGELVRRIYTAPDPGPETPMSERVLLSGVRSLTLRYLDEDVWYDAWGTPQSGPGADMADLVEFRLEFTDDRVLTQRFLAGGAGR